MGTNEYMLEPTQAPQRDDVSWFKIPFYKILASIREQSTSRHSWEHGETHWKLVAQCGLRLSQKIENCDIRVVLLFAMFHDAMRFNDGEDGKHGQRACNLIRSMDANHQLFLSPEQVYVLTTACLLHNQRVRCVHPTIGTCFDADRLNYPRGGASLDATLLSTWAAKDSHMIAWSARQLSRPAPTWESIWQQFVTVASDAK